MRENTPVFILSFLIWVLISSLALISSIADYEYKIEVQEKIKNGECTFMDQHGRCWSAEEYQNYLEKGKNFMDGVPEGLLEDIKKNTKLNEYFIEVFQRDIQ